MKRIVYNYHCDNCLTGVVTTVQIIRGEQNAFTIKRCNVCRKQNTMKAMSDKPLIQITNK